MLRNEKVARSRVLVIVHLSGRREVAPSAEYLDEIDSPRKAAAIYAYARLREVPFHVCTVPGRACPTIVGVAGGTSRE
jgi:hypothetical protein